MTWIARVSAAALVALLAHACGGGDGGAGEDGGAGADGGGRLDGSVPEVVDPSNRFALESEEWSVPDSGLDEGFAQPSSFTSYRYWSTLDVDGDGRPDIVQTGTPEQSQSAWDAAGSPYWKVFPGADRRWDQAVEWRLPPSGASTGFYAVAVTGGGEWRTFDIDGDRKPDLVHTADPATGYVWDSAGAAHWKVFLNDGEGGFERPSVKWLVPDSGSAQGFHAASHASSYLQWSTLDVDGDRKPDLVQTADPATGYVWDSSGSPHWKVFRNTGDGFERQATIFPVPDSGSPEGFFTVSSAYYQDQWVVLDLDDDGKVDLVQTADPATGTVWDASGEPYWKIFPGDGERLAAAADKWPVPDSGLADGFSAVESQTSYRHWTLLDIDGDRDLDLVQTGDVSHGARVWDATGDPYWKVYRNQGAGFTDELHRWPIPESGTAEGFYLAEGSSGTTTWFLADADADGHPDLLQTEDPATSRVWDATGSPYWKVFLGQE